DGSRIALYGGYGADRNRLVTGELTDDRMQSTAQYRLVLPDGRDLPRGARVIGRGPNLHVLTPTTWYRLDLHDLPPAPCRPRTSAPPHVHRPETPPEPMRAGLTTSGKPTNNRKIVTCGVPVLAIGRPP